MKQYKTTDRHFQTYKKEFMKWYRIFNLGHIEVYFVHEQTEGQYGYAWTSMNSKGMVATVCLQKDWEEVRPNVAKLKKTAFHECMELFLFHARNISNARFVTRSEGEEEWHRIIRTLELVVFGRTDGDGEKI